MYFDENRTEELIGRIRQALNAGMTDTEIAEYFQDNIYTQAEIFFALEAARILNDDEDAEQVF